MPTKYRFVTNNDYVDFWDDAMLVINVHKLSRVLTWSFDSTPGINFDIDGHSYHTDDVGDISFDDVEVTSQTDFITKAEAMFPGLAGGSSDIPTFDEVLAQGEEGLSVVTEDATVEVQDGKRLIFNFVSTGGIIISCPEYADNAAALSGGRPNGSFYCTNVDGEFIVKKVVD